MAGCAVKGKALQQISVTTSLEAEDAVVELLGRIFEQPAAVYTHEETKVTIASVYCSNSGEWNARRLGLLQTGLELISSSGIAIGAATISTHTVARQDWAESWKRHFKPIAIGSRLLIKPSWIERRPKKDQAVVVLDPGLSFGTGNHPTTAFCLRVLVTCRQEGQSQSLWDVGTGSGILAIAAVKLGYSPVRAFDFDPEAVRVAKENARINCVNEQLKISRGDITRLPLNSRHKYQVICANLISNLLIAERQRITNRLRPDGTLILAGILQTEFHMVQSAFEELRLKLISTQIEGEWQSGAFSF